jgi:hypothetical protein
MNAISRLAYRVISGFSYRSCLRASFPIIIVLALVLGLVLECTLHGHEKPGFFKKPGFLFS